MLPREHPDNKINVSDIKINEFGKTLTKTSKAVRGKKSSRSGVEKLLRFIL